MNQEDIFSEEDLKDVMDEKGYVHHSISIRENRITTLGNLKKVYGNLGIDSESLVDLGELNYVKQDFWIQPTSKNLKSLCKIERVGGNVSLRYSNISSLGNLWRVGGKLSLRDSKVTEITNLKFVGELFLPKRFEGGNYEFIGIKKKIRFWNDKITKTKNGNELKDVGGDNLRFSLNVNLKENSYTIKLYEWKVPTNPNDKFYKSFEELHTQNQNFQFYKDCILSNHEFLKDFDDTYSTQKFFDRLKFEQLSLLKSNKINEESFIETIMYYEKVFSSFNLRNGEFIDFFKLKEKHQLVFEIFLNTHYSPYFSEIHELELELKKRVLFGKILTSKCVNISNLNEFIVKNINEFNDFIDKKLDEIYNEHYSFYYSLFGDLKSVKQINDEFPKMFKVNPNSNISHKNLEKSVKFLEKRVKLGKEYINKNKDNILFTKFYDVKKNFDKGFDVRNVWNSSQLWLSHIQNPLSYYGYSTNSFIYFIENIIHEIFSLLIFNSQDEFRVLKGLPKIGEGWVSETELFNLIKYEFENEKVIHHGKPMWLGKQHVDIWFPKHKIGIEYQGKQHDEPIEFFGGEESFIKNQERDRRKKKLFKENNSTLIEVREGYDFDKVINEIKGFIKG